jgi:hypothetical protein
MSRRPVVLALLALGVLLSAGAPASADVAAPPGKEPYVVMTAGDSYAAGEGAPEINGTYDSGGDPPLIGFTAEDWDSHFGNATTQGIETERCHRSPLSPSGVATTYLAGDFPDVQVDFESVACSGASIIKGGVLNRDNLPTGNKAPPNSGGLLRPYIGADPFDGSHPGPFPPQLDQIDSHLNFNGTGFKTLDALILGAGGNDAGFATFVAACGNVITLSSPHDDCTSDNALKDFRDFRLSLLPGHYDRLAAALLGNASDPGDAQLSASHVPEAVLLTAIPAVARKTSTAFCNSEPDGDQTSGVASAEASMLENTVRIPLDDNMRDAAQAHGWTFVNSHVNDFIGHAICQTDRWINQNNEALRRQGDLPDTDPCCGLDAVLPDVSGGWVHPNARGYQQIGGALYRQLAQQLVLHVTPHLTPSMSVANTSAGVVVFVTSEEHSLRTTGYYHAFKLLQVAQDGSLSPVSGADGFQTVGYGQQGVATYDRTGRYLVLVRACGPVARDASVGCGPAAQVRISTLVPSTPIEVKANSAATPNPKSTLIDLTVQASWKYADAGAAHDTTSSRVTVVRDGGGFGQTFTVAGRSTAVEKTFENVPAGVYRVVVQSCNDQVGCSGASALAVAAKPFGILGLPRLGLSPVSIANYTCDRDLIPWGAPPRILGGRNGTGGAITLVDPNTTIVPGCLDDPPVGRLSVAPRHLVARAGHAATLTVGWEHPRRWGELHTVSLRLRNGKHVVSTLTFDLNAGTVDLARGADAHGQRARLASGPRRVTLGSGSVRLLLDAKTFRRPARLVRAIRLKLRLVLGRSLAGHRLSLEMAATGDDHAEQAFAVGGTIQVRRR